jgi:hypothetical protein
MNSHDTIERFLNGTLSPNEMASFLEKVETDTELQALLESDRIINTAIGKERSKLMNHDLSGVAGAFVAGLAATSATASSGLLTAAYAKKAGMSWITLTASTILSVSLSLGAYWYISSNEKTSDIQHNARPIRKALHETPATLTIAIPATIPDKPEEIKPVQRKKQLSVVESNQSQVIHSLIPDKPVKIRLEHSSSKYRPKIQE